METQQLSEGSAVLQRAVPSNAHHVAAEHENTRNTGLKSKNALDEQPIKAQPTKDTFETTQKMESAQNNTSETYSEIEENTQKNFDSLIKSMISTSVKFTSDDSTKGHYIQITDKATNELLRTIPSEAMRKVLDSIHDHIEDLLNETMDKNLGHIVDMSS